MGAWVGGGNAAGLLIDKSRPRRLTNTDARSTTSRRVRCSLSLSLSLSLSIRLLCKIVITSSNIHENRVQSRLGCDENSSVPTAFFFCFAFHHLRCLPFCFFCDIFALCIAALLGFLRELGLKKKKEIKQLFFLLFFAFFFFFYGVATELRNRRRKIREGATLRKLRRRARTERTNRRTNE